MSKVIFRILRIAATILGAIISLYIAHIFNPFSLVTSIPVDKVYDVCIAVYFSLTELIVTWGMDKLKEVISNFYIDIEAIISHRNEDAGLESQPSIRFNEVDMSEMALTIKIHGTRKILSDLKVVIPKIAQADYQSGRKSLGASINSEGDFCIELSAICGQSEKVNISETFLITIQRAHIDDKAQIIVMPEISPKGKFRRIRFLRNSAIIKLEGR